METAKNKDLAISPTYNEPYNEETQEALREYEEMKTNKEKYKRYNTFSDMLKD